MIPEKLNFDLHTTEKDVSTGQQKLTQNRQTTA